jgi:hypothetical protein
MAGEPAVVWDEDAADFQRDTGLELVRIPAEADAGSAGNVGVVQKKLASE